MLITAASALLSGLSRHHTTARPSISFSSRAPHTLGCRQTGRTRCQALVGGSATAAAMSDPAAKITCPQGAYPAEEVVTAQTTTRASNAHGVPALTGLAGAGIDSGTAAEHSALLDPVMAAARSGLADRCACEQPPHSSSTPHCTPSPPMATAAAAASVSNVPFPEDATAAEQRAVISGTGAGRKRALAADEAAPVPPTKKQAVAPESKKPWGPRPNHFLAVQLSQYPKVVDAFQQVQAALVAAQPSLKPTFIDPASAHITLFVLTLDGPQLQQAQEVLHHLQQQAASMPQQQAAPLHPGTEHTADEEAQQDGTGCCSSDRHMPTGSQQACEAAQQGPAWQDAAVLGAPTDGSKRSCRQVDHNSAGTTCVPDAQQPAEGPVGGVKDTAVKDTSRQETPWNGPCSSFEMDLRSLGHFNDKVLFLQVASGPGLQELHRLNDAVTAAFKSAALYKEQPPFDPHATISKMSKLYSKQRKTVGKRFPAAAYSGLEDVEGGRVAVEQVVLCSMQGRRQGAFYPVDGCLLLPRAISPQPPRSAPR